MIDDNKTWPGQMLDDNTTWRANRATELAQQCEHLTDTVARLRHENAELQKQAVAALREAQAQQREAQRLGNRLFELSSLLLGYFDDPQSVAAETEK